SFWQHSDQGQVSGITMRVDFNVFAGNAEELKQLLLP
ncbi:MAG TPA: glycoside hydrolase, partial [Chitinophagaceae bacterium]|nr:glycoside hydrolase [Chitinophagaceae bacterium]